MMRGKVAHGGAVGVVDAGKLRPAKSTSALQSQGLLYLLLVAFSNTNKRGVADFPLSLSHSTHDGNEGGATVP